jgi:tetratricopeptide (TPR) repeat protein
MQVRKIGLMLMTILALLAYSRYKLFDEARDGTVLPELTEELTSNLTYLPPVGESIAFFQKRIQQNPRDAVSYTLLGELYLRQGRESGDVSSYERAEDALRQAIQLLPGYAPANAALAAVLHAQHDFSGALELAGQVYNSSPKNFQALATVGDAQLALGHYNESEQAYQVLLQSSPSPAVQARLAHLAELKGQTNEALELMQKAALEALNAGGTRESVAWYWLRLGDLSFNNGQIETAGGYYQDALKIYDGYYLALAGLGKVRAAQGDYQGAIELYQRVVDIIPQPDFLAALGDLYTLTGQTEKARLQYATVEYMGKLAEINQQVYNRQLAYFYADHDLNVETALRLALAELEYRQDIYGYDVAGWAYYKNAQFDRAQAMMELAMQLGTRDARLYYHAGLIARAQGDEAEAQRLLEEALVINPHFDLLQARQARAALDPLASISRGAAP